jgi:hypothetical protein
MTKKLRGGKPKGATFERDLKNYMRKHEACARDQWRWLEYGNVAGSMWGVVSQATGAPEDRIGGVRGSGIQRYRYNLENVAE